MVMIIRGHPAWSTARRATSTERFCAASVKLSGWWASDEVHRCRSLTKDSILPRYAGSWKKARCMLSHAAGSCRTRPDAHTSFLVRHLSSSARCCLMHVSICSLHAPRQHFQAVSVDKRLLDTEDYLAHKIQWHSEHVSMWWGLSWLDKIRYICERGGRSCLAPSTQLAGIYRRLQFNFTSHVFYLSKCRAVPVQPRFSQCDYPVMIGRIHSCAHIAKGTISTLDQMEAGTNRSGNRV